MKNKKVKNPIVVLDRPKAPVSEAYRTLRTNIIYATLQDSANVIAVTSADTGEGKTTVSCNLAAVLAQSGKRVLIIDSDMRKPAIQNVLNISNERGLSNILKENTVLEEVAHPLLPNLDVLTAGTIPQDPSEILSSTKMRQFIKDIAFKYDKVIIDTPPVNLVTDAQLLAAMAEGVILVVGQNEAKINDIKKAKELLNAVNAKILGVVFNKVDRTQVKGISYYGY